MDPDVRLLRYFLVVAEELNFTRAAERVHIAQPSLSAQIRQLEAQLGVTLLRRSTRSVSLTEAGRALCAQGPGALTALENAWQGARDAGHGTAGALRLVYTLSAGHDTVPHLVQALHEASPAVTVNSTLLPTPEILLAVRDGRADAGVARAAQPLEGVRVEPLRHDREGILVASDHPLAGATSVDLASVADHPVVLHPRDANPAHHDFIRGLFACRGLHPSFLERDIALDLSQRHVTEGEAVALVGRSETAHLPADVDWVPLTEPVTVTVALVLPAERRAPVTRHFERVARRCAAEHQWLG